MGPSTPLNSWGHRGPRSHTAQAPGTFWRPNQQAPGSLRPSTAPWMSSDWELGPASSWGSAVFGSSWCWWQQGVRGRGPQVDFPTVQVWVTQHEARDHFSGLSCEKGHSGRTLAGPIGSQAPSWGMSTLHLASGARGSPLQAERLCAIYNSAEQRGKYRQPFPTAPVTSSPCLNSRWANRRDKRRD